MPSKPPILPTTNNGSSQPKRHNSSAQSARPVPQREKSSRKRPEMHRAPTTQTEYIDLLIRLDDIPRWHNILAAACTWVLLAGYLVFPGTFTSLQTSAVEAADSSSGSSVVKVALVDAIQNVGLLWVAGACCVVGALGLLYLWIKWWWHYIWLLNRIFLPATTSSLAGLISTLVNIYTAQDGHLSVTAKATMAVTAGCSFVFCLCLVFYQLWLLRRVKSKHEKVIKADEKRAEVRARSASGERGPIADLKRKAKERPAMPGGVI